MAAIVVGLSARNWCPQVLPKTEEKATSFTLALLGIDTLVVISSLVIAILGLTSTRLRHFLPEKELLFLGHRVCLICSA